MSASEAKERTFAFVDLAGFTALTEAMGDTEAVAVLDRFTDLTHQALADADELVKEIGDAVMLVSPDPDGGVSLAARLFDACSREADFPVPRGGLHHGPAVSRGRDWIGATVNLAARVAGQAHAGQVLATAPVAEAARCHGLEAVHLGSFELRNVADPVDLWEIQVGVSNVAAGVDPVCRMQVLRDRAAGRLRYEGSDYWFCSLGCAASFAAEPARYAG